MLKVLFRSSHFILGTTLWGCYHIFPHLHACVLSRFSCVWLCGPVDCSPSGPSVHGILQARILEWCVYIYIYMIYKVYNIHKVYIYKKLKVAQSCPTLCNPMDYTVHGILQARLLEWVAFPFSTGSSQPRDRTQVSHIAGGFFTSWAIREAVYMYTYSRFILMFDRKQ